MAPNLSTSLYTKKSQKNVHQEKKNKEKISDQNLSNSKKYEWKIVWKNVILFIYFHIGALYGFYLWCNGTKKYTILWFFVMGFAGSMGVTAGAHRLWSHRAYKAKWPLRFLLMLLQTLSHQNHIYEWVRDHRVHHKFTDTDADPHNAHRGFFFSHIGWLLVRKHSDVIKKGATVDMSDLEKDPIVVFQRRNIGPTENLIVSMLVCGEGWHNYHHVFPWDYKAAELGGYKTNLTTAFIDFCALLGQAYDLKTVSEEMIAKRIARTGSGSSYNKNKIIHHYEDMKWGWGDEDMKPHEIEEIRIYNKKD
ncbi:acyl-CoA Delta(11) desaturase isoform X2 [Apis mellifera]|uniref:Acyl-CoA Delta(11) desaturase isoform X2 n=1 Tax=Apis mellifera TaxID=7460 RepID=A0A7M7L1D0_APIME|nr:acyl-CoA Delta(11) desaturase isoform X2 [Apis mellifera]|eukprot:XP_026296167.1 acyl-CoA Delta(11) desaturase isoform X2 [Apis mellifera]